MKRFEPFSRQPPSIRSARVFRCAASERFGAKVDALGDAKADAED